MVLTLSAQEVRLISKAQQAFLQPLNHETSVDWLLDATRYLKYLVGADKSAARIPVGASAFIATRDFSLSAMAKYVGMEREVIDQFQAPLEQIKQQVWTRASLYGDRFAAYQQTVYYNEFIPLARNYYSLGMTVPVGEDQAGLPNTLSVYFNQDSPKRHAFGRREIDLLRLVFPALEAGFRLSHELRSDHSTLVRTIDRLHVPLAIFACSGENVHRTPLLAEFLEHEPEADQLEAEITQLAQHVAGILRQQKQERLASPVRHVSTTLNTYTLRSCVFADGLWSSDPYIGVQVEARVPPHIAGLLRQRYGLTVQESRVALLVGQHMDTKAMAQRLGLSIYTVRHHIEHLMHKLQIRKRSAIHPILEALSTSFE